MQLLSNYKDKGVVMLGPPKKSQNSLKGSQNKSASLAAYWEIKSSNQYFVSDM